MRLALLALILFGNIAYADCLKCQPVTEIKTTGINCYSENRDDCLQAGKDWKNFSKGWLIMQVHYETFEYNIEARQWQYKASVTIGRIIWR